MSDEAYSSSDKIYDSARRCLLLFGDCVTAGHALAVLQPHQQRYWAWANSLKVFARSHISLDAQLRADKSDKLRKAILLLLNVLSDNLNLALKLEQNEASESLQSTTTAAGTSTMQKLLKVCLSGIEGSLQRIDRLAIIILRATEGSLVRRILAYAEQVRDEQFEEHVDRVLHYRFQNALPTELGKLIRDSILHRYYRIKYERVRCAQEAPRWERPQQAARPSAERPAEISRPLEPTDATEVKVFAERHQETQSEVKTTPLTLDRDIVEDELDKGQSLPPSRKNADTASMSETGDALYPRPPDIKEGQAEATCPICLKMYDIDQFEGLKWRAHVDADVQPYVCIWEDCSTNLHFFVDRRSWSSHMQETHTSLWIRHLYNERVWECALPHEHVATYETEKELFEKHMQTEHSNLAVSTLQSMARSGGVPQLRCIDICPVCGDGHQPRRRMEDDLEKNDSSSVSDDEPVAANPRKTSLKPKIQFVLTEEQQRKAADDSEEDSADHPSLDAIAHKRMERYIGKHLKALAFYFVRNLIAEDDEEKTNIDQARDMDNLESVNLGDLQDPPTQRQTPHTSESITDKIRIAGEAFLYRADQFPEIGARGEFWEFGPFTTWLATYGNLEYMAYERKAGNSPLSYDQWTLSKHVIEPYYLYHINEDPQWKSSEDNNPGEEEREWLRQVYAMRPNDCLNEGVEVWSGVAPNTAYAVAVYILLALELCSRHAFDARNFDVVVLDHAFQKLYRAIDSQVTMIKDSAESGSKFTSDHTKALRESAAELATIAKALGLLQSTRLGRNTSSSHISSPHLDKDVINSYIKTWKAKVKFHIVLAIQGTRAKIDMDHLIHHNPEWFGPVRTILELFFTPATSERQFAQTIERQAEIMIQILCRGVT